MGADVLLGKEQLGTDVNANPKKTEVRAGGQPVQAEHFLAQEVDCSLHKGKLQPKPCSRSSRVLVLKRTDS